MRTIALITLTTLLAVAACQGCDQPEAPARGDGSFRLEVVSLKYELIEEVPPYGGYVLVMKISGGPAVQEISTKYEGTDVFTGEPSTLVEYFDWYSCEDTHTECRGMTRDMLIYPATVRGCDIRGGFAHLPANLDGSFVTAGSTPNVGLYDGETRGRVTSADMSKAIHWRTEAREDRLYLWIDGVEHPLPAP